MSRLSPLLFFVLALISAHVAFGAPSCRNSSQVDDCVSKCKHKFGLWPSSSTPSPTPAVDGNPYSVTTPTPSSSTYNPNASGNPPSNGGDDVVVQQPSTSSPTPTPTPTPTPSPTPSSGSGDVSADDIATWLSDHNSVRAQYGASDLTWSDDLSSKAQQWANGCVFKHSGGTLGAFGENLAAGTGNYTITNAVDDWVSEASQYDPSNPVASHFTQVVWKSTTQLGCAVAACNGIFPSSYGVAQYYVCEYNPPGNVDGEFGQNVQ
ncbi:CAP domain containing protein [Lactarius tabidus]|jgi:uncharacterized protein YkwD